MRDATARDPGIAKDNAEKSLAGARSEFADIGHICAASTCNVFLTADRRCGKLAYAVFEGLETKTVVVLLNHDFDNNDLTQVLGPDAWP
jgi:hypothetical protein